jgi:subtilase family serine protease
VLACADDLLAQGEVSESNNCLATSAVVVVGRPDLVVTTVSVSPETVTPGATLSVMDTVQNVGVAGAGNSKTRYYVSNGSNPKLLSGVRQVGPLAGGDDSSGNTTVTVPSNTPVGSYVFLACADDQKQQTESNEANNCRAASGTITVGAADVVVDVVSNPPPTIERGKKFPASATTRNQGVADTGRPTRTRYYLSLTPAWTAAAKRLTGYRVVDDLAPGATDSGDVNVGVPSGTTPADYYLVACGDDTDVVTEQNETNNCRPSTTRVTVTP